LCPSGATTMSANSTPPSAGNVTDNVVLCVMPGQPGGYMVEDPASGSIECHRDPSSGACSCPVGSTGVQIRIENGGNSLWGGYLVVCQ
jgi:hypothetical protein